MNWLQHIAQTPDPRYTHPRDMTEDEFINYHYTGHIDSSAYDEGPGYEAYNLDKVNKIVGPKEKYPVVLGTFNIGNNLVELRKSDEKLQYVKYLDDERLDLARDEQGNLIYLSDEEMDQKDLPRVDLTIHAFIDDIAIGWVGESFGATELFIAEEYRNQGIGTFLLKTWLDMHPSRSNKPRRLGQMTPAGEATTRRVHQRYMQE